MRGGAPHCSNTKTPRDTPGKPKFCVTERQNTGKENQKTEVNGDDSGKIAKLLDASG